jgi:putative flippase GtrA
LDAFRRLLRLPIHIAHADQPVARPWLRSFAFAMIGLVNTGIDFGVFTFTYYYLGWHILVANPIAWLLAVSNSYVLNSMITFAAETGRRLSVKAYITFIFTQAGGLVANTMTVFVLSYFMPAWMAKIPAIGASFIVDFTLSHLVVFRRREELSKS